MQLHPSGGSPSIDYRRMVVCRDVDDTVQVSKPQTRNGFHSLQRTCNRQVAFMFPGQGSQYVDMGTGVIPN
jgi:acyl transferase domain-containing protein